MENKGSRFSLIKGDSNWKNFYPYGCKTLKLDWEKLNPYDIKKRCFLGRVEHGLALCHFYTYMNPQRLLQSKKKEPLESAYTRISFLGLLKWAVGWRISSSTPFHEYLNRTSIFTDIAILTSSFLSFRWINKARNRYMRKSPCIKRKVIVK